MKTYELHTFTKGQWVFHSVYEDSETAKTEAQRLKHTGAHAALSITEEIFDEATSAASSRTIFTTGETNSRDKTGSTRARAGPVHAGRSHGAENRRFRGRHRGGGAKATSIVLPIFILVSLVIAGAGALYGLQLML